MEETQPPGPNGTVEEHGEHTSEPQLPGATATRRDRIESVLRKIADSQEALSGLVLAGIGLAVVIFGVILNQFLPDGGILLVWVVMILPGLFVVYRGVRAFFDTDMVHEAIMNWIRRMRDRSRGQ